MEKYWNQAAISLAVSILGCLSYVIYVALKRGIENVQEKEMIVIFADCLAICAALKILYLSFDPTLCRPDARVDLTFLALGGLVIILVSTKNLTSKFK